MLTLNCGSTSGLTSSCWTCVTDKLVTEYLLITHCRSKPLYISGSQYVVRVPLVVYERFPGSTRDVSRSYMNFGAGPTRGGYKKYEVHRTRDKKILGPGRLKAPTLCFSVSKPNAQHYWCKQVFISMVTVFSVFWLLYKLWRGAQKLGGSELVFVPPGKIFLRDPALVSDEQTH